MYWALLCSVAASLIATPLIQQLARRIGFVDRPDGQRKTHTQATALGGGAAVLCSIAAVVVLAHCGGESLWLPQLSPMPTSLIPLLAVAVLVFAVGLVDDFRRLRAQLKLALQCCLAVMFVAFAGAPEAVRILAYEIPLGPFSESFAIFWIMGAINSVNLIDGLDGFASTVSITMAFALGVLALMFGHPEVALLAMTSCGAVIGFAVFNRPPASIFLGDAGSTMIGFTLGAVTLQGAVLDTGAMLLAPALAIWTIPVLDTAIAILRRAYNGQSIFSSDRGHLHHRLLACLGGPWRVLALTAISSLMLCGASVLGAYLSNDLICISASLIFVGAVVLSGVFGEAAPSRSVVLPVAESGDAKKVGRTVELISAVDNVRQLMSQVESLASAAFNEDADDAPDPERVGQEARGNRETIPRPKAIHPSVVDHCEAAIALAARANVNEEVLRSSDTSDLCPGAPPC